MTPARRVTGIIREVAEDRGVDPLAILGPRRHAPLVGARIEIAKRLRDLGYGPSRIGTMLTRDHTTVLYYLGALRGRPTPAASLWVAPERKPQKTKAQAAEERIVAHMQKMEENRKKIEARVRARRRAFLIPYAGADRDEYKWKAKPT